jgi:S1-C subfamily serine protease
MTRSRSWIWLLFLPATVAIAAEPTTKPANSAATLRQQPINEQDSSNIRVEEWKLTLLDDQYETPYRGRLLRIVQGASYGFLGIGINNGTPPLRIQQVVPGSGAEKAGVLVNDKILALGDLENPDAAAVMNFVRNHNPGEQVRLKVDRFGVPLEFQVQLISVIDLDRLVARTRNATPTTRP